MNSYTPTKEFNDALVQLQTGGGEIIGLAAKSGNSYARAVIDLYKMMYKRPDHAIESLFLAALENFKKSLAASPPVAGTSQEKVDEEV